MDEKMIYCFVSFPELGDELRMFLSEIACQMQESGGDFVEISEGENNFTGFLTAREARFFPRDSPKTKFYAFIRFFDGVDAFAVFFMDRPMVIEGLLSCSPMAQAAARN